MKVGGKGYGSLFLILFSISTAIILGGVFYYLQTKNNEYAQNQLHFTELFQISNDINNAIEQVHSVAKQLTEGAQKNTQFHIVKSQGGTGRQNPLNDTAASAEAQSTAALLQASNDKLNNIIRFARRSPVLQDAKIQIKDPAQIPIYPDAQVYLSIVDSAQSDSLPASGFYLLAESDYVRLVVSLKNIINKPLQHFPIVLLSDQHGQIKLIHRNNELDAYQHSLNFENITALLEQQNTDWASVNTSSEDANSPVPQPAMSNFFNDKIGGVSYRVFINPQTLLAGQSHLIVGLRPLNDISMAKLYLSPSVGAIVIVSLLLLIAFVPLIKVRFISQKYCFTVGDLWRVAAGLVIGTGVLTIAIYDQTLYSEVRKRLRSEAENSYSIIQQRFDSEVNEISKFAEKQKTRIKDKFDDQADNQYLPPQSGKAFIIEAIFKLSESAKLSNTVLRADKRLDKDSRPTLSFRNYFKKANSCDAWPGRFEHSKSKSLCQQQFYIERIFNISDARLSTQFSWPLRKFKGNNPALQPTGSHSTQNPSATVLSADANLLSLKHVVLPRNMKFAIFDNQNGDVLYHSNDQQSLVENFYITTYNNPFLKHIVQAGVAQSNGVHFSGKYKGVEHDFYAGKLHPSIPWTLVVFHDKRDSQFINMLVVVNSILLFLLVIILLLSLIKLFYRQLPWAGFGLYQTEKSELYIPCMLSILACIGSTLMLNFVLVDITLSLLIWSMSLALVLRLVGTLIFPSRRARRLTRGIMVVLALLLTVRLVQLGRYTPDFINQVISGLPYVLLAVSIAWLSYWSVVKYYIYLHGSLKRRQVEKKKSIRGYCFYVVGLVMLVSVAPAIIMTNANFWYHIESVTQIETTNLNVRFKSAQKALGAYHSLIFDANEQHSEPTHFFSDYAQTNKNDRLWSIEHTSNTNWQSPPAHVSWHEPIIQFIYGLQSSSLNIPAQISVLSHTWDAPQKSLSSDNQFIATIHTLAVINSAFVNRLLWLTTMVLVIVYGLYYLVRNIVAIRLFGLEVPENFRLRIGRKTHLSDVVDDLYSKLCHNTHQPFYAMIIRPERENIERLIKQCHDGNVKYDVIDLHAVISITESGHQELDDSTLVSRKNAEALQQAFDSLRPHRVIFIKNLGAIAFEPKFRVQALQFIEYAMTVKHLSIVILADVSPLFKLTRQEAYPKISQSDFASPSEITRWSNLFTRYTKFFDWNPQRFEPLPVVVPITDVLARESSAWPELKRVNQEFHDFHCKNRLNSKQKAQFEPMTLPQRIADNEYKQTLERYWTEEQIIEFFTEHAGAVYRYRWEICTQDERVLLYQLATRHIVNPLAHEPLEHLIRRGYVVKDGLWSLASKSFSNFVLSAETQERFKQWLLESEESIWRYLRIPLFTLIVVLLGFTIYSATETYESIIGLLTALLGLFPLLMRNLSLIKVSNVAAAP